MTPLTAHAYLGGLPIARALDAGADVVVTGRVTDAALVTGPGIWRFGWDGSDLDALAGAVVAGHVIECGCQATGGNYSFFAEVPDLTAAGFPLAELAADGSAVITKHPGTGGQVSVGTVTAQLLYEIGSPRYLNPDVTARFDTIAVEQAGPDRVRVSGVRGEPPPGTLKVSLNYVGGYRNSMILAIEGLDVAAKARLAEQTLWSRIDGGQSAFEIADVELVGSDPALLRITVLDQDKAKVGRAFSAAVVETALASYPGFYALTPPGDASMFGVYWPTQVPAELVTTRVLIDGRPVWSGPARIEPAEPAEPAEPTGAEPAGPAAPARTRDRPHGQARRTSPYRRGGYRSARSPAPARATRAATPTSGSGSARPRSSPGWTATSPPSTSALSSPRSPNCRCSATRCRTCSRSTSSWPGCSAAASRRARGSTRRPRRSGRRCAPRWPTSRSRCSTCLVPVPSSILRIESGLDSALPRCRRGAFTRNSHGIRILA